jgi:hypothetical protein
MTADEDSGSTRWDGWLSPKQWGPIAGVLVVAVGVLAALLALGTFDDNETSAASAALKNNAATHQHADFAVFIRGAQFDFSRPQFVSGEGDELDPYVHIHSPRFTVVHVHKLGVTWDYFLHSLGFKLDDPSFKAITADKTTLTMPDGTVLKQSATETFKFYVNGVRVDGVSNTDIHDLDRVLISFGTESVGDVVANQLPKVTDQACIPSERCSDRIPAGEPPEQCTISNDTCVKPGG